MRYFRSRVAASGIGSIGLTLMLSTVSGCTATSDADASEGVATADLSAGCSVTAPPPSLGLHPFYKKYCSASGMPVVASANVPDAALQQTARIINAMLKPLPGVKNAVVGYHGRYAILGPEQHIHQIPERASFPIADNRAVGASPTDPVAVSGEENVLCYERDGSRGENIVVHEMGHIVMEGLALTRPSVKLQVRAAFNAAKAAGKYPSLYAGTNEDEYWAEAVQDYLGAHQTRDAYDINTRDALKSYDPALYAIVESIFAEVRLPSLCPAPSFDADALYRIQNVALGPAYSLDNGTMNPTGAYSGQAWHLRSVGNGRLGLSNTFTGNAQAFDTEHMAPKAPTTGQAWTIRAVTTGKYRLTNDYRGPGQSLEVNASRTIDLASTQDESPQLWTITRVE